MSKPEEAKLLNRVRGDLEKALTADLRWLAHELHRDDVGFLNYHEHEQITDDMLGMTRISKAGVIVGALYRRVLLAPGDLKVFVDILRKNPQVFKPAINLLDPSAPISSSPPAPHHPSTQPSSIHSPRQGDTPPFSHHPHGAHPTHPQPWAAPGQQPDLLMLDTVDSSELDREDDFAVVVEAVQSLASSWEKLAIRWRFKTSRMDVIARDNNQSSERCLSEVVKEFLRKNYNFTELGHPCWRLVVWAVAGIDINLAQAIANGHRVSEQPPSALPPLPPVPMPATAQLPPPQGHYHQYQQHYPPPAMYYQASPGAYHYAPYPQPGGTYPVQAAPPYQNPPYQNPPYQNPPYQNPVQQVPNARTQPYQAPPPESHFKASGFSNTRSRVATDGDTNPSGSNALQNASFSVPDGHAQPSLNDFKAEFLKREATVSLLTLIKWRDSSGKQRRLRLLDSMSPKWKDIGKLVEISDARLSSIEVHRMQKPTDCMKDLASDWRMKCSKKYPATWEGVVKLLEDAGDLLQLVEELRQAAADPGSNLYER